MSDDEKVTFAGTLLEGYAVSWWASFRPNNHTLPWNSFQSAFIKQFSDPNEESRARVALDNLKQGNRPVSSFVEDFKKLLRKIPNIRVEDSIHTFVYGLRNHEVQKVVLLENPTS